MNTAIDTFLNNFLTPPPGSSPKDIKDRLLHWIEIANHPEVGTADPTPHTIAQRRRKARQNVRRLALRHPAVADQLMLERSQMNSQETAQ